MSLRAAAALRGILASLLLLASAAVSSATEEILLYNSHVDVRANGDLLVTETIRVNAEGVDIRRGIYRDFPVTFEDADGNTGRNSFELISATRDGAPENYRIVEGGDFVRVYLGKEDVFLSPRVYTYELVYRTDRQVRFFDDHDEVYWNATGTEWMFPIRQAVAVIDLPDGAVAQDTVAYTGSYGSTAQNATASVSADGNVVTFQTTRPLGPRQGLTVDVAIPKGVIAEPSDQQKLAWYLRDNIGTLISVGGLVLVFLYYFQAWVRVGRDPARGVVVPRWDLPEGVSPALTHYIWNKGLTRGGFPAISAAAVNLAVKGYLELDDIGDTITLRRTGKSAGGTRFPVGETQILNTLDGYGGSLTVSKTNGTKIQKLAGKFVTSMEKEHRSVFYRSNTGWIVPGVILSVLVAVATFAFGRLGDATIGLIIPITFVGAIVTGFIIMAAKRASTGLFGKLQLAFMLFVASSALLNSGLVTASGFFGSVDKPLVIGAFVTLVMTNLLFFFLLGAPTRLGRT
ncbi:MAG: DUF2207 domain-containing protein, partial [Oricola sp.]